MKITKISKSILFGAFLVMTIPNLVLAATENQKQTINVFGKSQDKKPINADLKQLFDSKTLERNLLKGISRFRVGGNSGGGGDEIGMNFQRTIYVALGNLYRQMPEVYSDLEQHNLTLVAQNVKIIVVDDVLDVSVKSYIQSSVAVNLPETNVILVNRHRWMAIRDRNLREAIALHEILSLKKLESTGAYPISSRYLSINQIPVTKLNSSLGANRIQQIQALAPLASPYQVLKKFYEVDCSVVATRHRTDEAIYLRKESQMSTDLKIIDSLSERLDQLRAVDRQCMRANLSLIDAELNQ